MTDESSQRFTQLVAFYALPAIATLGLAAKAALAGDHTGAAGLVMLGTAISGFIFHYRGEWNEQ